MKRLLQVSIMSLSLALIGIGSASANEYEAKLHELATTKIAALASEPAVIAAVKAQNAEHAGYDAAKIEALDKEWRAEADKGGGDLTNKLLGNALSKHLTEARDASGGLYAEIFVMDDVGLNVGASNLTSDYMQGDEAKWQKTYSVGPDAVQIDDVKQDESSGTFVSQVSVTVTDPETKHPIGALTVSVDVSKL